MSRSLALAEALRAAGASVEIELVRGTLTDREAERSARAGLWIVESSHRGRHAAVVVDLPDPGVATERFDHRRLVVFDDRNAFAGRTAIVVQPGLPTWTGPGAVERVLAGYLYSPVSDGYRLIREGMKDTSGGSGAAHPLRVVACFGGSDPSDVTGRLVPALAATVDWTALVVVGPNYVGPTDHWRVPWLRDPGDLPGLIAAADMVLIGAGTMKFEAACVGRPSILLAVADDQLVVGPTFAATGAALYLGDGRTLEPERVRQAITSLAADTERCSAMGAIARSIVDGLGARRIAAAVVDLMAAA